MRQQAAGVLAQVQAIQQDAELAAHVARALEAEPSAQVRDDLHRALSPHKPPREAVFIQLRRLLDARESVWHLEEREQDCNNVRFFRTSTPP